MSMPLVSQNLKLKPGPLVLVPMNNPEHQPDLKRSLHLVIQVGGDASDRVVTAAFPAVELKPNFLLDASCSFLVAGQ